MIVADTGNNRLQVFHIDILAGPHDDACIQATTKSGRGGGGGGGDVFEALSPSSSIGDGPSSTSPVAQAKPQVPSLPTTASSGRDQKSSLAQVNAAERRPGDRKPQDGSSAAGAGLGDVGDDSFRACLLVFTGAEDSGRLRKRRTAGESETAEGPLCQPCDLAYWRAQPPGRGMKDHIRTATRDWTLELPPWFRPHTGHGFPRSSSPGVNDEETAKRELLPLVSHSQNESSLARTPTSGAFLVRETGIRDELQLLFVAETQVQDLSRARARCVCYMCQL